MKVSVDYIDIYVTLKGKPFTEEYDDGEINTVYKLIIKIKNKTLHGKKHEYNCIVYDKFIKSNFDRTSYGLNFLLNFLSNKIDKKYQLIGISDKEVNKLTILINKQLNENNE